MRRVVLGLLLVSACTERSTHDVPCSVVEQAPAVIDVSDGAQLDIVMTCAAQVDAAEVSCQHVGPGSDLAVGQVLYFPLDATNDADDVIRLRGDMPPGYLAIVEPKTIEARIDCGLEWNTVDTITWQVVP